jgi:hypothetical protein
MPCKNTCTYIGILFQCMMFDVELKRGDNSIKRHLHIGSPTSSSVLRYFVTPDLARAQLKFDKSITQSAEILQYTADRRRICFSNHQNVKNIY